MKKDVLILGARPYDFKDDKTGKQITGVSCHVLPLENPDPANVIGLLPTKYSLTQAEFALYASYSLPARAEIELDVNLNTGKIRFAGFDNIQTIDLDVA